MAKKKKSQLKPVARGFATTSVAKKATPEVQDEAVEDSATGNSAEANEPSGSNSAGAQSGQADTVVPTLSDEEKSWQSFVDKYQDRVEKEITRTVKVSE